MSVITSATVAATTSVTAAADRADVGRGRRPLEQHMHARDQVDAGGDHRGGVDQRGHRRRALHRVGKPRVQRDLRGLGERADEQQQAGDDDRRPVVREVLMDGVEHREELHRPGVAEDDERGDHEADVTDDVDHERLEAGAGGGRAPVPERDQQVGRGADERPADDQQHEVPRQYQQQHREHEVVQVAEVARVTPVERHVRHRVQVDQRRDPRDHEDHEHRQRVDEDLKLGVDPGRNVVVPQRRRELAVVGAEPEQLDQGQHREHERHSDRERRDPSGQAPRPPGVAEPDQDRAHERAREDQPTEGGGAHPCSSFNPSTSIGSRRR